jgi:hypothetical protein
VEIQCVVACRGADGVPTFFACKVKCSQDAYDNGEHYEAAEGLASEMGYEDPFLVYDENDGPEWLHERFRGENVERTTCNE